MNEKIREFAKESGLVKGFGVATNITTGDQWITANFNLAPRPEHLEKLIELVVSECAFMVQSDTRINWLEAAQIAKDIKSKFGVEE